MLPLVDSGDKVKISASEKYKKGDILAVIDNYGRLILHRLIGFDGEKMIIKGDNAMRTEWVEPKNCFGRTVEILKKDGRIIFVRRKFTDIFIVLLSRMTNRYFLKTREEAERVLKHWFCRLQKFIICKTEFCYSKK
jgi:hypothetical protein